MTEPAPGPDVTAYLQRMGEGDRAAFGHVFEIVYADLRRLAGGLFRGGKEMTLQPTALVNEAYLRMVRQGAGDWGNRKHFYDVAAMAMRQLLTDHVRTRARVKRGGGRERVAMEAVASQELRGTDSEEGIDVEVLDAALTELEQLDPRQGQIVRLRFFTGLSVEETAKLLEISESTVQRDWKMARRWLDRSIRKRMNPE